MKNLHDLYDIGVEEVYDERILDFQKELEETYEEEYFEESLYDIPMEDLEEMYQEHCEYLKSYFGDCYLPDEYIY